jgi:hypothetical protein
MPNNDIQARVEAFTAELTGLIRSAALDAVRHALGDGKPSLDAPAPAARKRGRPAKNTATKPPGTTARPGRAKPKGAKRDPKELDALTRRLAEYIRAKPGQRIEQINQALGVATKDLQLPIKRLLGAKRITAKGQKRSTTYAPASGLVKVTKNKGKQTAKVTAENKERSAAG